MPDPTPTAFEALLADCIDQLQSRGPTALDDACAAHPEHADSLRRRVALLERAGLLDHDAQANPGEFPERLGDFRLLRQLGSGGMGVVYLAEEESLGRQVALKLIRPEQMYFTGARERFRREVQTVAGLQHPGIVPVYRVGEEQGLPYFAMELVRGASLENVLLVLRDRDPATLTGADLATALDELASLDTPVDRTSPLYRGSWVEACLRLTLIAAEAVEYAHSQGVLHRDVKPSNLMLTADGRVQLVDFGVSSSQANARITRTGSQVGSLLYMAPECVRGDEADARSDVYSFGVTLYELLSLQAPYRADSAIGVQARIIDGKPPALRERNPRVTRDAETVCLKALDRDPARRYASVAEFAGDLARVLAFEPITARRAGPLLRARRWSQRHPALAVGAALGSLLLVGMPAALLVQERRAGRELQASLAREEGERARAEQNLYRALDSVNVMLSAVARELHDVPKMEATRKLLLDEAVQLTADLESQAPLDKRHRLQLANTHLTRGRVYALLGDASSAIGPLQKAMEQFDEALAAGPYDVRVALDFAESLFTLGQELNNLDRNDESLLALDRAARLYAEALEATRGSPEAQTGLLLALSEGSQVRHLLGDREGALQVAQDALAKAEQWLTPATMSDLERVHLATLQSGVGLLHYGANRRTAARPFFASSYELLDELLERRPDYLMARERMLNVDSNYGRLLAELGDVAESEAVLRKALQRTRRLHADFPDVLEYARMLVSQLRSLATTLAHREAWDEADALFAEAYEQVLPLTEKFGERPSMHALLGDVLANWAATHDTRGLHEEALELVERALDAHGEATRRSAAAEGMGFRWRLGHTHLVRAAALTHVGRYDDAAASVARAAEACGDDPLALLEGAEILGACAEQRAGAERSATLDAAFDALRRAIALGLDDAARHLAEFRSPAVRSDARFAALEADLESDLESTRS